MCGVRVVACHKKIATTIGRCSQLCVSFCVPQTQNAYSNVRNKCLKLNHIQKYTTILMAAKHTESERMRAKQMSSEQSISRGTGYSFSVHRQSSYPYVSFYRQIAHLRLNICKLELSLSLQELKIEVLTIPSSRVKKKHCSKSSFGAQFEAGCCLFCSPFMAYTYGCS